MGRYWRRLRLNVVAGDVVAVFLAYGLAAGARFGFGDLRVGGRLWPVYPILIVGVALLTIGLGWQHGIYRRWALMGGHRVYPLLVTVATYDLVAVIILTYFVGGPSLVSRGWLLGSWAASIVLLSVSRLLWRQLALYWRRQGILVRKVLIAGANQQGIAVAQQLHDPRRHGTHVLGFLDDYQRPGTEVVSGLAVVGHPGSVLEQAQRLGADEVIIIAGALAWESQRLLAEMVTRPDSPIEARISPTFYDLLTTSAELSHVAYVPMLTLNRMRISGINQLTKELLDRSVAATMLILMIPAWCYWRIRAWVVGVPMLARQPVLGVGGRPFDVVGLNEALTRSPVVARLPALWNVLWQDLSLVGPCPIRAAELAAHERWLANLFAMRPGLTGLWRLRGQEVTVEERVALDLYYVRNYTLTLDLQVLFNTARQLVRRVAGKTYELARWQGPESVRVRPGPVQPPASEAPSTRTEGTRRAGMPGVGSHR